MALVERLCQVPESEPGGEPSSRHISTHAFVEAQFSVLGGYITVGQVKAFYSMTAGDIAEYDTLIGKVAAHSGGDQDRAVHRIGSILTFYELGGVSGYTTVAEIRTQFGAI